MTININPRACNTGVISKRAHEFGQNLMLSATIDWISCTSHQNRDSYPGMIGTGKDTHGLHSYTRGYLFKETGLWVMYSPKRPDMGLHMLYSGEVIRKLQTLKIQPDSLLKLLVETGVTFTRLDLAIDAKSEGVNLDRIKTAIYRKEYSGRERVARTTDNADDGYSIYVGAPTSDRKMRLYNKAAEQALDGIDWKRLELELHRRVSDTIARAFCSGSMGNIHDAAWAIADKMLPDLLPATWKIFGKATDQISVPNIPHITDTERWLINTVAPTIEKFRQENPNSIAIVALKAALGIME